MVRDAVSWRGFVVSTPEEAQSKRVLREVFVGGLKEDPKKGIRVRHGFYKVRSGLFVVNEILQRGTVYLSSLPVSLGIRGFLFDTSKPHRVQNSV